jgi:excisionase family DNA binding protein
MREQPASIREIRGRISDRDGSTEPPPTASESRPGRLLEAEDVADLLGVNATFVYALVRRGDLPAVRIGERYVRFRAQTLARWIEEQETSRWRGSR